MRKNVKKGRSSRHEKILLKKQTVHAAIYRAGSHLIPAKQHAPRPAGHPRRGQERCQSSLLSWHVPGIVLILHYMSTRTRALPYPWGVA